MSTINKENKKNSDESVNQPPAPPPSSSTPSFLSNYKWWFVSFTLIILISFVIQRQLKEKNKPIQNERLFTADELKSYTKDELYLAILGHVFNVSSAPRFYSSTGSYKFYTGRDASRSFHTGKNSPEDLTDDLTGLSVEDKAGIYNWLQFYQRQYTQIGKLIGRYFDSDGTPTEHYFDILASLNDVKKIQEQKAKFEQKWPPCNSESSHGSGRRVWCTTKSGGIERSWTGVPRRYFDSLTKVERCVCVENANKEDGRFKQYKNCLPTSFECQILD